MAKVTEGPNRYLTLDELELRAAAEREVKLLEAELRLLNKDKQCWRTTTGNLSYAVSILR
jgi:hypothetical protein